MSQNNERKILREKEKDKNIDCIVTIYDDYVE